MAVQDFHQGRAGEPFHSWRCGDDSSRRSWRSASCCCSSGSANRGAGPAHSSWHLHRKVVNRPPLYDAKPWNENSTLTHGFQATESVGPKNQRAGRGNDPKQMVPICLVFGASLRSLFSHDLFREIGAQFRGPCSSGQGSDRPRSSRRSWRFALVNGSLGQPPRNTRPFVFQRVPTHRTERDGHKGQSPFPTSRGRTPVSVAAARTCPPSRSSLDRQRGETTGSAAHADRRGAERMEPACGDAVLTKEPVEDFQKIGPGRSSVRRCQRKKVSTVLRSFSFAGAPGN